MCERAVAAIPALVTPCAWSAALLNAAKKLFRPYVDRREASACIFTHVTFLNLAIFGDSHGNSPAAATRLTPSSTTPVAWRLRSCARGKGQSSRLQLMCLVLLAVTAAEASSDFRPGTYYMTHALLPLMQASCAAQTPSPTCRVITVSSGGMYHHHHLL